MTPQDLTVAYYRVSDEEQRERQSIETQRDQVTAYAARMGITIADSYADDGVSGTIAMHQRPEGARLLADARAGRVQTVLVFRTDRLGRDPRLILNAVEDLVSAGATPRSITEPFELGTPAGQFMLTMLAGMAGFERDSIIQRSVAGTERLARAGVWLGGIVPFGYVVPGKDRDARLMVDEEPIPEMELSPADVVRLCYRKVADEGLSCIKVADYLNAIGVPTVYQRDGRQVRRGTRKVNTAGMWRASRVRNLIANPTYKGEHHYGTRSAKRREVITREVAAIVEAETWERAQQTLRRNMVFAGGKEQRHPYLLRGLLRCGLCGLTFCGSFSHGDAYFKCNGKVNHRGLYGAKGTRCPSRTVRADVVEAAIWAEIEGFLREPGAVIDQLAARQREAADAQDDGEREEAELTRVLADLAGQRDAMLTLFRKGRIDGAALDRQLDEVAAEERAVEEQRQRAAQRREQHADRARVLTTAADLLTDLRCRLDGPLTFEVKRRIVEALVAGVVVETIDSEGRREAELTVTYRFEPPADDRRCVAIGTDVPVATPATRRTSAPAPGRRSAATSAASPGRCWTVSTSPSRRRASPTRSWPASRPRRIPRRYGHALRRRARCRPSASRAPP